MTPAQRKRIFDALLWPAQVTKAAADDPAVKKICDDFLDCVAKDVAAIEPIIDELVTEAVREVFITPAVSPEPVSLRLTVIPDGTDLLVQFRFDSGIIRELHISRAQAIQFARYLMDEAKE